MDLSSKKILIAEDERPLAKALCLKLSKAGAKVFCAYDGQEALEQLAKEKFDYILCDLMMPKVDGFKVLEVLQKSNNTTPVAVLSNLGQEEDVSRAKSMGAKEYFVKADTPLSQIVELIKRELSK